MIMEIIPAIDIRGGKCVRLYQGNYSQETVFAEDPVDIALDWQAQGASRLHVVDLDGAAGGEVSNMPIIEAMAKAVSLPIQLGGGIRSAEIVEKLLGIGIERVILGTAAVERLELVKELCNRFGGAIVIGIDARDGYAATHGWQRGTDITALELARMMADLGVGRLIYTDIKRDGTLTEPNFEAVAEMINSVNIPVIASGGVSSVSHLEKLKDLGAEGAIVGRALYTGDMKLSEALTVGKDAG